MPESPFQVGELIENRYRVLTVIGSGGMGTLYRIADEAKSGEVVAMKMIKLDTPMAGPGSLERFRREFQMLTQMQHPNLVSVHDFGITADGQLYFTMEWIEGSDFESDLHQLEPKETLPVIVQICRALAYLHARGVIHGDLKPGNVLLVSDIDTREYQVKLVDFGVALELRSPELRARYYTPGFSAPEIKLKRAVDHRIDLYSLGALWYDLLMGEPPLFSPGPGRERLIQFTLDEALQAQPEVPSTISAIVARLLATSAQERYASANEVIEAVNEATGSSFELETRETASSYALRTHFVNREAEIELLQTAWQDSKNHKGKLILVGGESGVGKTRLVTELEIQAEMEGARVVWGQCVERGGDAYHPWREVLRVLIRYVEGENVAIMRQVGPVLTALLPELWIRDYLADASPPAELDPQAAQLRLNNAIAQVLQAAGKLRPTVVMIENAHWADEASLEMLRFLARVSGLGGLLTCVTYRDDEVNEDHLLETLTGEQVHRARIRSLSPPVTSDLVRSMLGLEKLPVLLTQRVQQTTGGNAFFVQELIRSLAVEGEVLHRTVDGWQVDDQALQETRLPDSIRQVVDRRLGQLSIRAKQVLEWASVVGLVFWEGSIAEVGPATRAKVRVALEELIDLDLVVVRDETSFAGEQEYLFINPTVREASYEGIQNQVRQRFHKRVAEWLLAHSKEEVNRHLGLLAEHLEQAGQVEEAIGYYHRASEQAMAQFANSITVAYLSRALKLLPEDNFSERYKLLLARERVYDLQGAREAQEQDLTKLKDLTEALSDERLQTNVALRQAAYCEAVGDYPAAITAAQQAIHRAQAAQDVIGEAAGYSQWGTALWRQSGNEAAQPKLEQALALIQNARTQQPSLAEQSQVVEAHTLRYLGLANGYWSDRAKAYTEQALHLYREMDSRQYEAGSINNLGFISLLLGDYGQSEKYSEQALLFFREIGDRRGEGITLSNMGLLFHNLGDDQSALEYSQQALHISQEIGDRYFQGYALTNLGHALAGQHDSSNQDSQRLSRAADAYQHALDMRRELGHHDLAAESLAGMACIALAQQDLVRAQSLTEEILNYLDDSTLDSAYEPFRVYLTCYRILHANQDARAQDILKFAHTRLQKRATNIHDPGLRRSFLETVPYHREIVREYTAALA